MNENQRRYDRYFAPRQSEKLDDALYNLNEDNYQGCSCHINYPCSYCLNKDIDEEESND